MKTANGHTLVKHARYNGDALEELVLAGWTAGDGSGSGGYRASDYFEYAGDGATYRGPDRHGIEPVFED